jgi:membrane-associated phospholipid phosphatase
LKVARSRLAESPRASLAGAFWTSRRRDPKVEFVRRLAPFLAIAFCLWLAMLLAGGPGWRGDRQILWALRTPDLARAAAFATRLGNGYVLLPLCAVAGAALFLAGRRRAALLYLGLVVSGRILVEAQKALVARPRPGPEFRLGQATGFSFPSAHAANSTIAWLGLALLAAGPRHRPAALAAAALAAGLIGLTRLALAVHWPSDVVGGWAFGAAWTWLFLRLADGMSRPHLAFEEGAGK